MFRNYKKKLIHRHWIIRFFEINWKGGRSAKCRKMCSIAGQTSLRLSIEIISRNFPRFLSKFLPRCRQECLPGFLQEFLNNLCRDFSWSFPRSFLPDFIQIFSRICFQSSSRDLSRRSLRDISRLVLEFIKEDSFREICQDIIQNMPLNPLEISRVFSLKIIFRLFW